MAEHVVNEKRAHHTSHVPSEIDESKGVFVVARGGSSSDDEAGNKPQSGLKTSKDGKTILIPQPSDDPNDPLNWTWMKKHAVLLALLPGCFLTDWVITYGTTMVFHIQF